MSNGNFKPRVKTALDFSKLKLYGEKLDGAKSSPSFSWYLTEKGHPRIDVWTGLDDQKSKQIRGTFDIQVAIAAMGMLEKVIGHDGPCRKVMSNSNYTWFGGKKSDSPKELTRLVVGKAEDGRVYISLLSTEKDMPRPVFYFRAPYMHKVVDGQGEPAPAGEESEIFAQAYVDTVKPLLIGVFQELAAAEVAAQEAARQQGGGNNNWNNNNRGGGNNNGGHGGGGGNQGGDNFDFDMDLPM